MTGDIKPLQPLVCALTREEADILRSLMAGAKLDMIASETGLADAAVRHHIKSILKKARSGGSYVSRGNAVETGQADTTGIGAV